MYIYIFSYIFISILISVHKTVFNLVFLHGFRKLSTIIICEFNDNFKSFCVKVVIGICVMYFTNTETQRLHTFKSVLLIITS